MTTIPEESPRAHPHRRIDPGWHAVIRFAATLAAWVIGLFGLMRLGWVQQNLLLPFAGLQQRLGSDLTGAPMGAVVVDMSCTGADVIALCLGVILAFPAPWRTRIQGGLVGLLLIAVMNTLRIASLSFVATNGALMNLLHIYVWPTILIIAVSAYVFVWINRHGAPAGVTTSVGAAAAAGLPLRFLLLAGLFVAAYFALAPSIFQSPLLYTVGGWAATSASAIILPLGGMATVSGNVLTTTHGSFIVTQECLATPLIRCMRSPPCRHPGRRSAPGAPWPALAAPLVFFGLGMARLLVLALPAAVVPSHLTAIHAFSQIMMAVVLVVAASLWLRAQSDSDTGRRHAPLLAIGVGALAVIGAGWVWDALIDATIAALQAPIQHAGHAYVDAQGAFAILPVFQLGLFVALWVTVSTPRVWRRLFCGLLVLALTQVVVSVGLGELFRHIGVDLHVSLIRAWALSGPVALVWLLERPQPESPRRWPRLRVLTQAP